MYFEHDCENCIYQFSGEGERSHWPVDVYFCPARGKKQLDEIVVRYGDSEIEYISREFDFDPTEPSFSSIPYEAKIDIMDFCIKVRREIRKKRDEISKELSPNRDSPLYAEGAPVKYSRLMDDSAYVLISKFMDDIFRIISDRCHVQLFDEKEIPDNRKHQSYLATKSKDREIGETFLIVQRAFVQAKYFLQDNDITDNLKIDCERYLGGKSRRHSSFTAWLRYMDNGINGVRHADFGLGLQIVPQSGGGVWRKLTKGRKASASLKFSFDNLPEPEEIFSYLEF